VSSFSVHLLGITIDCGYYFPSFASILVLIYTMTFLNSLDSFLSRSRKNGTATGVNVICIYHHDPENPEMDIHGLYLEINNLTHGITQLGNYSLDNGSLYINGECALWFVIGYPQAIFIFIYFLLHENLTELQMR
jgi:hypothetical protein